MSKKSRNHKNPASARRNNESVAEQRFSEVARDDVSPSQPPARPTRKWLRRLTVALLIFATLLCILGTSYFWYRNRRVAELIAECQAADEAQNWEQLERAALQWYHWQPEHPKPLLYAAFAATERGSNRRTALYLYQLPNVQDPLVVRGLLELSHLQFGDLNQPIAATETCQRLLRLQPDHQEARRRLAYFYVMTRQRKELIDETRAAIRLGADLPETYLYLTGADWMAFTNGQEVNERWLQSAPGHETFIVAAAMHYVRSAVLDAETVEADPTGANRLELILLELLNRYPKNLEVLSYHLDLACFRSQLDRAIELMKQAPSESLDDSRFWGFKGWIHEQRGEMKEAEAAYQKAVEMYPYASQVHLWLAAFYRQQKQPELAEKHQTASALGKDIMRQGLQIPNTESIPPDLLEKMRRLADLTGDGVVADRLAQRLKEFGSPSDASIPSQPSATPADSP